MPQRFLKPGITTSDAWNAVSFPAQSLYIRLLTLVDDFGRYDGRLPILHAHCFALRSDVKPQQTAGMRDELSKSGLIFVYEFDGKEYIQFAKWTERTRSDKSKYPDPPQESAADGSISEQKVASLVPVHRSSSNGHSHPLVSGDFDAWWKAYPSKVGKDAALKAWKARRDLPPVSEMIEKLEEQKTWAKWLDGFIPNPSTYLNQGRWQDEKPQENGNHAAIIDPLSHS